MPRQGQRRAALSIRLSAVIVTATIDEPRVLTVHIWHDPVAHDPVEALPSGPLELEHRTLEGGLDLSQISTSSPTSTTCAGGTPK